jgi:hypothetical protein
MGRVYKVAPGGPAEKTANFQEATRQANFSGVILVSTDHLQLSVAGQGKVELIQEGGGK